MSTVLSQATKVVRDNEEDGIEQVALPGTIETSEGYKQTMLIQTQNQPIQFNSASNLKSHAHNHIDSRMEVFM